MSKTEKLRCQIGDILWGYEDLEAHWGEAIDKILQACNQSGLKWPICDRYPLFSFDEIEL